MTKNSRFSFVLAILIILAGAALRLSNLTDIPPGLSRDEVIDLRLAETVRQGSVRIFFDLNGEGREVLYPAVLATVTAIFGAGTVVYALFSVAVGMVTQALTFALARRLYGDLAGMAALGFMAFTWWPVMLSRTIGRETLLPLLVVGVLLSLALGLPVYGRYRSAASQTVAFASLGAAMAIGLYLHPVGLVVMLMSLVFIGYYMIFGRPRINDSLRRTIGFTVLLTLIFIVPYLLSAGNMPNLSGAVRLVGGLSLDETPLIERMVNSFLGLGIEGDPNPLYNIPGRPLVDPVSGLLIIIGGLAALRYSRRRLRYALLSFALVVLAPLAMFAPFTPSWMAGSSLMPVLALCFGLGASSVARLTHGTKGIYIVVAVLLVGNALWTSNDLFRVWPQIPEVQTAYSSRVAQLAQYVDRTASSKQTLICSADVTYRVATSALTNTRLFSLMMNNRSASLRYMDCMSGMIFPQGGRDFQVVMPNPNLPAAIPQPIRQWLELGTEADDGVWSMDVVQPLADRIGLFTTTAYSRLDPTAAPGAESILPPIRLENNLTFLGYETLVTRIQPGGQLPVLTYWRVDGLLPSDLVLFTHLYDDIGAVPLANQDIISVIPSQLSERDVFAQLHLINIPETLPERHYTVAIGAYRVQSANRLGILPEPGGIPVGNRLILYDITVALNP